MADVAEQRSRRIVLDQRLPQCGQDERGGAGEPVQNPRETGCDVVGADDAIGSTVPGDAVHVVAFIRRQPQCTGQCRQHLRTRLRSALLFESGVVVGGHRRELCDLFTSQAGGPAARTGYQADIRRLEAVAPADEEAGERITIHLCSIARTPTPQPGIADPPMTALWMSRRPGRTLSA